MPNNMFEQINPYNYNIPYGYNPNLYNNSFQNISTYLYEMQNKISTLEKRIEVLENSYKHNKNFEYETSMNMM